MIFWQKKIHFSMEVKTLLVILAFFAVQHETFAQNASFTLTNASGCVPLNVQFNNTSTGAVSYFWDFGDGNTSVLQNPSDIYLVPGNYNVKLVAYNSGGQADSVIISNAVTVIQKPTASFSANTTVACANNNAIQFTNSSANFDSCLWDFGDGAKSSMVNPVHSYANPGTYTVTLICFNKAYGCSESFTQNQYITIGASPSATVSVNVNSSCNPAQVFNFSTAAVNAAAFNWNFGDNNTSTVQNPSHAYAAPGIYTVTLITTSAGGCKDTLVLNNYIDLKSNPVPSVSLSDSSGCLPFFVHYITNTPFTACLWTFGNGDSSTLANDFYPYQTPGTFTIQATLTYANGCSNSVSYNNMQALVTADAQMSLINYEGCSPLTIQCVNNSTNASTYLWDFGDGNTSTAFSPTHTYTTNGWYNVKLTATNANGCSSSPTPWVVKVKGPGSDIFADVTAGCPPLTVNFMGNPAAQTGYYWDFGDGNTSTAANPQHTYSNIGNYVVKLAVTNAFGCTDTNSTPVIIHVATPTSNFVPPAPVYGCAPMNVNLSDNTPGAGSWQWDFGDGSNGSGQTINHTYSAPGTYIVNLNTGSGSGGCPQNVNNFSTFIVGGGTADFTYNQSLCPPYTAWFQDSSTNAVSWLWDFGDGTTSSAQNPTHIYSEPGVYNVSLTITTADGCSVTRIHNYALNFLPLIANASAFTSDTTLPMNVTFHANSIGATWWLWSFGDSTTSSLENPTHTYTAPGPYNISLTIGNDSCSYTYSYPPTTIGVGEGNLSFDPDSIHAPPPRTGCSPMAVNFHNPFSNTVSWLWTFGDGGTSSLAEPTHVYTQAGIYDVTLYATHANGTIDSLIQPASMEITGGVNADFTIDQSNSCAGNTVSLAAIGNTITNYSWNFGDSTTSNLANPVHTFANANANYIISLFASDSTGCSNFMTKSFYGYGSDPLIASKKKACGNDSVFFESGNLVYSSYVWHFGDGDSSMLPDAWHQYHDTGTYVVTLTVTDTSGCEQTLTLPDPVQIFNPEPDFTMTFYPVCVGAHVIFTNASVNADSYLWDFGDSTTSSVINPVHYYVNPGTYTVTLTAFKNNCSSTYTLVNPIVAPNTTIDFNYTQNSSCLPITINCTDLSTDAVNWLWDFGDGSPNSTLQNPSHTFTQVPYADIILTIENANGCRLKKNLPNINPTIASFSLSDTSGCSPVAVSFADSSSNAVNWLWNFGDGNTSSLPNPQHTYTQDGYFPVQLIVQSSSGCSDTLQYDSLVHVSSVSVNFLANKTADCAPAIIDFSDLSLNANTWTWYFGDGSSSQQQNPLHIYTTPGIYDVKLVVSNAEGCTDSLFMPAYITVHGSITAFGISDTSGCGPVSIQFSDSSVNAVSWNWNFGDGASSAQVNPAYTYSNPGNYTVSLITADTIGCESSFTFPVNISVHGMPVASYTVSDTIGCNPLAVIFTDASTGYDSLYWNFGDGTQLTTSGSVTHSYSLPGNFYPYLVAYTSAGCADTLFPNQLISVGLQPSADFNANTKRGCAPLQVGFQNISTGIQNASTYLWDFGNGDTSSLENPNYTFTSPGLYTVTLTVSNGVLCNHTTIKSAFIQVYDSLPPPESPILSVTVLNNTSVEITWQNSAVPDLAAYELYRFNPLNNKFEPVYINLNPNNAGIAQVSVFKDTMLNTLSNTYTYKLRTLDICENALPLDSLTAHTTIDISALTGKHGIHVSWNPYAGCTVNLYEIYRNDPSSGTFSKIGEVPANTTEYLDTGMVCPDYYAYRVMATDLCGNTYTSESDTAMAKPENTMGMQQVEVVRTTVIDDQHTLTEWKPPLLAPDQVVAYSVLRSETENGTYQLIANVGPAVFNFMDTHADVHHQNYFYKIEIVNRCNSETLLSTLGSSILLLANPENSTTRLIWTPYKGWNTGVSRYVIEKQNANGTWETIRVVDGNTLETEDR